MKRLFAALLALISLPALAQFTPGQILTATALNAQFALYAPLSGATFTGPVNLHAPLSIANGGTGANTATAGLAALGGLSLAGGTLTGPLTVPSITSTNPIAIASGGTGSATATASAGTFQYLSGLTGAAARTYQSKFGDVVSVKDFGAKGDGVTDDTTAWQTAINSLSATCGTVYAPWGNYLVSTLTLQPCVSIQGASPFTTAFVAKTAGSTIFTFTPASSTGLNATYSDFSINAGSLTNVNGFQLTYANRAALKNLVFFGLKQNFICDRGGLNRFDNLVSAGTATNKSGGITLWSSTDTEYGCVFSTLTNYRIENNGQGVQSPAVYLRRAVGVRASQVVTNDSDGTGTGLLIENDSQGNNFSNSLFVHYSIGAVFQQGSGIAKTPIVNVLDGVDFDQNTTNSILMTGGQGNQIVGGSITSSSVSTTAQAVVLSGAATTENVLRGVHIGGYFGAGGTCVYLSGTSYNRLYNVMCEGSTQGIAFDNTNPNTYTTVENSDLSYNVTTPVAGSVAGAGNLVSGTRGFSGAALISSPSMPASGVAVTNNYGVPARIFINGGAISLIAINGVASGFTPGSSLILYPGETLSITYSSTPSWNWIGI